MISSGRRVRRGHQLSYKMCQMAGEMITRRGTNVMYTQPPQVIVLTRPQIETIVGNIDVDDQVSNHQQNMSASRGPCAFIKSKNTATSSKARPLTSSQRDEDLKNTTLSQKSMREFSKKSNLRSGYQSPIL